MHSCIRIAQGFFLLVDSSCSWGILIFVLLMLEAIEPDVISSSPCGLYNLKCYQLWLVDGCWSLVDFSCNFGPSYVYNYNYNYIYVAIKPDVECIVRFVVPWVLRTSS
jgi:hypothetical protein